MFGSARNHKKKFRRTVARFRAPSEATIPGCHSRPHYLAPAIQPPPFPMAEPPKVSILLPSLNAREFLEPRIDSILRQTFSDWEAIVLDSHSTDGSWEFFQSIANTDPRFRLYQIPREGLYAALNRGLDLAQGEFLH